MERPPAWRRPSRAFQAQREVGAGEAVEGLGAASTTVVVIWHTSSSLGPVFAGDFGYRSIRWPRIGFGQTGFAPVYWTACPTPPASADVRRRVLHRHRVPVVLDHVALGHECAGRAGPQGSMAVHLVEVPQRGPQRLLFRRAPRSASLRRCASCGCVTRCASRRATTRSSRLYTAIGDCVHTNGRSPRPVVRVRRCDPHEPQGVRARPVLRRVPRRRVARRALREETELALSRTGPDVGTPIITFQPDTDRERTLFGPVIPRAPKGDEAVALWDALQTVASSGVAEIKRTLRGEIVFD